MIENELKQKIDAYIRLHYAEEFEKYSPAAYFSLDTSIQKEAIEETAEISASGIADMIDHLDAGFSESLLKIIDDKQLKDADVYHKAGLDRRLFSKIRSRNYRPSKQTALSLCVALNLDMDETEVLLKRAGYALSPSSKADVIVSYFIENKIYDLYSINEALLEYDQKPLSTY